MILMEDALTGWGSQFTEVTRWTSFCHALNQGSLGESSPVNRDTQEKTPLVLSAEAVRAN